MRTVNLSELKARLCAHIQLVRDGEEVLVCDRNKPVARRLAFWDTSALVPLCVRQSITPHMVTLYRSYQAVVWWTTPG